MLVETGFWPPNIPFDIREVATVVDVINTRAKEMQRARKR